MTTTPTFDTISLWTGISPVATGGFLTFPLPTGREPEDYTQARGAFISVHETQGLYSQDAGDFLLIYGPTSIIAGYRGVTTIPAGSVAVLQAPLQDGVVQAGLAPVSAADWL